MPRTAGDREAAQGAVFENLVFGRRGKPDFVGLLCALDHDSIQGQKEPD